MSDGTLFGYPIKESEEVAKRQDEETWAFSCYQCNMNGWIVFCIDDLCRGAGWCMHGDGERPCPNCNPGGRHNPLPPSAGRL